MCQEDIFNLAETLLFSAKLITGLIGNNIHALKFIVTFLTNLYCQCVWIFRFCINLIHSRSHNHPCLLHFDFRFDQGETVRNTSYPSGGWAHEERSPLPIIRGRFFCVEIKSLPGRFTVDNKRAKCRCFYY